jgi:hypothetical protein
MSRAAGVGTRDVCAGNSMQWGRIEDRGDIVLKKKIFTTKRTKITKKERSYVVLQAFFP